MGKVIYLNKIHIRRNDIDKTFCGCKCNDNNSKWLFDYVSDDEVCPECRKIIEQLTCDTCLNKLKDGTCDVQTMVIHPGQSACYMYME